MATYLASEVFCIELVEGFAGRATCENLPSSASHAVVETQPNDADCSSGESHKPSGVEAGLRVFTVSKLSKFGKPYVVKTLSDLQCESAKELHWFLKARVCDFHGWGTYSISRSHGYGERRGFVLVCKVRLAKEAITILKTDPSHPVFNQDSEPHRKAFWEEEPDLRYVRVGLKRTQARPTLGSELAEYKGPSQVPLMRARGLKRAGRRDWAWRMNYLFRGT